MQNNESYYILDYTYWLDKESWTIHEASLLINGINPNNFSPKTPKCYYDEVNRVQENFYKTYSEYNSEFLERLIVKKNDDSPELKVNPALFIEWAYSEGYALPYIHFVDGKVFDFEEFAEKSLERPLQRYSFGRYMQFYKIWANKGYWTSNESINLLQNKDPAGDVFCCGEYGKGIPAINGGYNYCIDLGQEMERDVAAGILKILESKIPNQPHDIFKPEDIINWAFGKNYLVPKLLEDAVKNISNSKPKKKKTKISYKDKMLNQAESRAKNRTLNDSWDEEVKYLINWVCKNHNYTYNIDSVKKGIYPKHFHENLLSKYPKQQNT